jgi:hypothetical protein
LPEGAEAGELVELTLLRALEFQAVGFAGFFLEALHGLQAAVGLDVFLAALLHRVAGLDDLALDLDDRVALPAVDAEQWKRISASSATRLRRAARRSSDWT